MAGLGYGMHMVVPLKNSHVHICEAGTETQQGLELQPCQCCQYTDSSLTGHFLSPCWVQRKNKKILKILPGVFLKCSWKCVALGTRTMVKETAETSAYPNNPLPEPTKRGMKIQGRFLCAIGKNQVKVQPLDLRNKPFHDTPISKNG